MVYHLVADATYFCILSLNAMKCVHFTCETVTDLYSFRTVNNDVNV